MLQGTERQFAPKFKLRFTGRPHFLTSAEKDRALLSDDTWGKRKLLFGEWGRDVDERLTSAPLIINREEKAGPNNKQLDYLPQPEAVDFH